MKRSFLPGMAALLASVTLLLALTGCAKKVTTADANYTTLEGRHSPNARMFVWPDAPDTIQIWTDLGAPGPAAEGEEEVDFQSGSTIFYRTRPGVMHVMLVDATPASGYQVFRKAANGGFELMTDYVLNASRKWLNTAWELYETSDQYPTGYSPATYVGRGLVSGVASAGSPLSNEGLWSAPMPRASIAYTDSINPAPTDSLFRMSWTPVAGAVGYWLHVYQWKSTATLLEKRQSGTPSPIWNGNVKDFFVGFVAAPATSYKLGGPGAEVMAFHAPLRGQEYLVRITAVDADGRIVAYMHGSDEIVLGTGTYERVPLAAQAITPHKPK